MRWHNRLWRTAGMVLMLALPAQAVFTASFAASFADGARAYDSGDYATAFSEWHALAETGDPAAQIAIASLYRGGIGRPVDLVKSACWYRRAAHQGDAIAQMNLGEMYEKGWGVKPNKSDAYYWYSRAAQQKRGWATEQRDRLAQEMTPRALAAAQERFKKLP